MMRIWAPRELIFTLIGTDLGAAARRTGTNQSLVDRGGQPSLFNCRFSLWRSIHQTIARAGGRLEPIDRDYSSFLMPPPSPICPLGTAHFDYARPHGRAASKASLWAERLSNMQFRIGVRAGASYGSAQSFRVMLAAKPSS